MLVDFMLRKNLAVDDVLLLPEGRGFLLCEFGRRLGAGGRLAWRRSSLHASAQLSARAARARCYSARRGRTGLACARIRPGRDCFRSGRATGMGRLGRFRRAAGAAGRLSARTLRSCSTVWIRDADVRSLRPGLRSHAHHLRPADREGHPRNIANLSTSRGHGAELMADRLSGEHGDGQSRAALLPKMYGPELMQAFREFKALWDPTTA